MIQSPARPGTDRTAGRSRRAAVATAVVLLAVGLPASSSAAGGACPSLDDGVTVVVDFQHLGGGTVVRCAPGDPDSGLAALSAAGFAVEQIANQPGFVCRIDGRPGPDQEDCADTPPAKAYWGYSHAERGGSWAYSGSGAHVYDPPVGTVEGWAFNGDGGSTQPTVPPPPPPDPDPSPPPEPDSSPPPDPEPSPSRTPSRATSTSAETSETTAPGTEDDSFRAAERTTTEASATAPPPSPTSPPVAEATPSVTPTPTPAPGPSTPPADLSPQAVGAGTDGTPWGAIVGGALILLLVAAGMVLRTRREGSGG